MSAPGDFSLQASQLRGRKHPGQQDHRIDPHRYEHPFIPSLDHDGKTRTITLEPILKFQMKGLGYGHPQWAKGMWKGELEIGGESFDPQQLDPLAPEHLHVQQVVRARDGERTGVGVLEQICLGPYQSGRPRRTAPAACRECSSPDDALSPCAGPFRPQRRVRRLPSRRAVQRCLP